MSFTPLLLCLQIFVLESFPNSRLWWKKEDNVIPRSVAWSDNAKFTKSDYNRLFYSTKPLNKLMPTSIENQSLWWRSSIEFFQQLETSNIQTLKPMARRKFAPRICHTFVTKRVKQEVIKEVKHEVHARTRKPVEEDTEEEEEVNAEVGDQGLNGMSKSELVKKLADMERELTNYKAISTRLTAIEELLKPQIVPTVVQKAESIGLKIGEVVTGGQNSVIASNGVKSCETGCNNLVDVPVGAEYVLNKHNGGGVRKKSDAPVDFSDSVNNHNLVDVSVSVSNTFKDAYESLKKDKNDLVDESLKKHKHDLVDESLNKHKPNLVDECNAGRVFETGTNGVNNCVINQVDGDNGLESKTVCVDKFVTNVTTDGVPGLHASQV